MNYVAQYHIKHGVSQGLGIVLPDETLKTKHFEAQDTLAAILHAQDTALQYAWDYHVHPETGKTTVTLQSLCEKNGRMIDVRTELQEWLKERFRLFQHTFVDGHYTCELTAVDHALLNRKKE